MREESEKALNILVGVVTIISAISTVIFIYLGRIKWTK